MRKIIVPMLGAAALVAATSALALDGYHHRPTFQELDKDGNGVLTLDEVTGACQARATARFNQLDANHDGQVTQDEINAARQAHRERRKQEVPF